MRLREALREGHGTTLPRFDVLAALDRHREGLRMSDLSAGLRVSNGNVTGIVDRLVQEGLVERTGLAGDRRASCVRLTEAGRARFAVMAAEHEGWVDRMLSGLDAAEIETLSALLSRMETRP
jgi:DNA-binding MarR family transcriptional regulator